jgi:hypothetical protein
MDFGLLRGMFVKRHAPIVLPLRNRASEDSEPGEVPQPLSEATRRKLWSLLALDIAAVPWVLVFGSWMDETSKLSQVLTLGGHHKLVMAMAIAGLVMLAGLAVRSDWFTATYLLDRALIIVACVISMAALAGALSAILLLVALALLLGFGTRLLIAVVAFLLGFAIRRPPER